MGGQNIVHTNEKNARGAVPWKKIDGKVMCFFQQGRGPGTPAPVPPAGAAAAGARALERW